MTSALDALTDYIDEWSDTLHDVVDGSRVVYVRAARQFCTFLAGTFPEVDHPAKIRRPHVDAWMTHTKTYQSNTTRRRNLIAVRKWLEYLAGEPDIDVTGNPARGISLPEAEKPLINPLTDDELSRLLKATSGMTFLNLRDQLIIRIFIDSGIRREELVRIDIDDVDLKQQQLIVRRGKGGAPRIVTLGKSVRQVYRQYLRVRAKQHAAESTPAVFLGTRRNKKSGYRMTGDAVREMIKRRCVDAGIAERTYPHRFRHTWATDQLDAGVSESDVQRLGGWTNGEMVQRYTGSNAVQRALRNSSNAARGDRV